MMYFSLIFLVNGQSRQVILTQATTDSQLTARDTDGKNDDFLFMLQVHNKKGYQDISSAISDNSDNMEGNEILYQNQLDSPEGYAAYLKMLEGSTQPFI